MIATVKHFEGFEYSGKFTVSDQNIYIELDGRNHFEKILHVFNNPLHRNVHKLWGVVSGISVINEPFTAICLLTEDQLDNSVLHKEFDMANIIEGKLSFKVARDITLYTDNEMK